MGANEQFALEAKFEQWKKSRFSDSQQDFNAFEYFCIEQFLRPFDLSDNQLQSGMVGGHKDGGVDALFMFVNGELVDAEAELDPKTENKVRLLVMQVKEGEGFSPIAIDKLYWFTSDLFHLTRKRAQYHTTYRDELIALMRLFKDKYGVIVGENPELSVEYYYVVKKTVDPNEDCKRSAAKVRAEVLGCFENAKCEFHFVDAGKLWAQIQSRPPKAKTLKWAAQPLSTEEGFVGLVRLHDFYEFLKEPNGEIAERIFDSNVRGYWKETPVNKRIATTLKDSNLPEFWLRNNGITILAERTENDGHLKEKITDPQIVNGLQTSRQIFNYYRDAKDVPLPSDNRRVLVRIIKTADKTVRDDVIRSTNSQNQMPEEALRATDAIHRQIEALFEKYGLFYDRRQGHYKDQGKPVAKIVSVLEVLQAVLAIVIKRPDDARARPRNYFKNNDLYVSVFANEKFNLNLYLRATEIMRRVETFLSNKGHLSLLHRRNLLFYLGMYVACVRAGSVVAPPDQILKIDAATLPADMLEDSFNRVWKQYDRIARKLSEDDDLDFDGVAKGPHLLKAITTDLKRRLGQRRKVAKHAAA